MEAVSPGGWGVILLRSSDGSTGEKSLSWRQVLVVVITTVVAVKKKTAQGQ